MEAKQSVMGCEREERRVTGSRHPQKKGGETQAPLPFSGEYRASYGHDRAWPENGQLFLRRRGTGGGQEHLFMDSGQGWGGARNGGHLLAGGGGRTAPIALSQSRLPSHVLVLGAICRNWDPERPETDVLVLKNGRFCSPLLPAKLSLTVESPYAAPHPTSHLQPTN